MDAMNGHDFDQTIGGSDPEGHCQWLHKHEPAIQRTALADFFRSGRQNAASSCSEADVRAWRSVASSQRFAN